MTGKREARCVAGDVWRIVVVGEGERSTEARGEEAEASSVYVSSG